MDNTTKLPSILQSSQPRETLPPIASPHDTRSVEKTPVSGIFTDFQKPRSLATANDSLLKPQRTNIEDLGQSTQALPIKSLFYLTDQPIDPVKPQQLHLNRQQQLANALAKKAA